MWNYRINTPTDGNMRRESFRTLRYNSHLKNHNLYSSNYVLNNVFERRLHFHELLWGNFITILFPATHFFLEDIGIKSSARNIKDFPRGFHVINALLAAP
jgi:hypothetical protein